MKFRQSEAEMSLLESKVNVYQKIKGEIKFQNKERSLRLLCSLIDFIFQGLTLEFSLYAGIRGLKHRGIPYQNLGHLGNTYGSILYIIYIYIIYLAGFKKTSITI